MSNPRVSPNVKPAGYLRSLGGYSLDFLFTFLTMVALYFAIGRTAILPAFQYNESAAHYAALVEQSHLANVKDGVVSDISYNAVGSASDPYTYGYKEYDSRIFHYYFVCVAQTSGATEFNFIEGDGFVSAIEDKTSDAYKIEVGKWIYKNVYFINGDDTGKGDLYFKLPSSDALYMSSPSLKDDVQTNLDAVATKSDTANKLLSFFRNASSNETIYARAVTHFNSQASVSEVSRKMTAAQYAELLPSIIIAPLIFFFLIPIFSSNGQTLGKRIVKSAVLGADGYKVKKPNLIVHYLIILLEWELLLIPNFAIGLMAWMLVSIVGYMVLVMTKNHQSIHDKIANTIVINAKESIWFESEEAERSYADANPSSLVAKTLNGKQEQSKDGRNLVVSDAQIEAEDQILDLSTINRRREEARRMTSFDEFEKGNLDTSKPVEETPESEEIEEEMDEQTRKDMEALFGEDPSMYEEEEQDAPAKEAEPIDNEDDFVDGK